jgi:hypothetical protein
MAPGRRRNRLERVQNIDISYLPDLDEEAREIFGL